MRTRANFFHGVTAKNDPRFKGKFVEEEIVFPPNVTEFIERKNINVNAFEEIVKNELSKYTDDEFLADMVVGFLENPIIKSQEMGQMLKPSLKEKTVEFISKLWDLLIEANENGIGVPASIIEQRKQLIEEKMKIAEAVRKRIQNSSSSDSLTTSSSDDEIHIPNNSNERIVDSQDYQRYVRDSIYDDLPPEELERHDFHQNQNNYHSCQNQSHHSHHNDRNNHDNDYSHSNHNRHDNDNSHSNHNSHDNYNRHNNHNSRRSDFDDPNKYFINNKNQTTTNNDDDNYSSSSDSQGRRSRHHHRSRGRISNHPKRFDSEYDESDSNHEKNQKNKYKGDSETENSNINNNNLSYHSQGNKNQSIENDQINQIERKDDHSFSYSDEDDHGKPQKERNSDFRDYDEYSRHDYLNDDSDDYSDSGSHSRRNLRHHHRHHHRPRRHHHRHHHHHHRRH
ncbi:hypothetical protein TRFO_30843 [Tritrichomonas foetus]|uniref:PWI domain-containing protein n=1 Tax=Tritrichomonas foetus TaxID=1144522 RepID=A0A1J4JUM6_9EUKA|nr:hypothetical protein TRFO_30843 [Tritrichomonas foetus]|eukprot:OHT02176.1 hypothetical protein TRFO_30843 [Tritrichomonas foetus]